MSKPPMHIAVDRVLSCRNGELDLSGLGLTMLPPIPEGIIELNCSQNQLTNIPRLPSTLEILMCTQNQLTSLPTLPSNMFSIRCSDNPLTTLPTLPLQMEEMDCFNCQLTSLPTLPANLRMLNCLGNPMEDLPALPLTLQELKCELSMHEDPMYNGHPIMLKGMYPDWVEWIDHMLRQSMFEMNQQSKERCNSRCLTYKEQIMMKAWHPSRVAMMYEMGYDVEDM